MIKRIMKWPKYICTKQVEPNFEEPRAGKSHAGICEGFTFQSKFKVGG